MLRFDKGTYLSRLFKFILSARLSKSLWRSDVLLFSEFLNIVSLLFYNFFEFIRLYNFLVIYLAPYREYIIFLISFSKFSDIVPAYTCARLIDNLWYICLGVIILVLENIWKTCTLYFYWKYFAIESIKNSFFTFKKVI